jgi:hypothetical protein
MAINPNTALPLIAFGGPRTEGVDVPADEQLGGALISHLAFGEGNEAGMSHEGDSTTRQQQEVKPS